MSHPEGTEDLARRLGEGGAAAAPPSLQGQGDAGACVLGQPVPAHHASLLPRDLQRLRAASPAGEERTRATRGDAPQAGVGRGQGEPGLRGDSETTTLQLEGHTGTSQDCHPHGAAAQGS